MLHTLSLRLRRVYCESLVSDMLNHRRVAKEIGEVMTDDELKEMIDEVQTQ